MVKFHEQAKKKFHRARGRVKMKPESEIPYPCSYSNWDKLFNFLVFTATSSLGTQLSRVRAAAKMSAGGVGSPSNQL